MKITEINIKLVKPKEGLVGFASFVIDDSVYCSLVSIHTRIRGGYRLVYPTKIVGNRCFEVFHPISLQAGMQIEQAVVAKYRTLVSE